MFDLRSTLIAHEPPYCVTLHCCECGQAMLVEADKFATITHDYVVLKDDVDITCKHCGSCQPKDERYIPHEPQPEPQVISTPVPRCPTCGSTNIEKISSFTKAIGFAAIGIFSSNFGKTMYCRNCGYKW